ncbi:hypothetical protein C7M84_000194 [Penaeus vannamei]|uniref:Uncharacterized protein n=1 Tax=Penaeus vannamei TaxID=6689 RepID=A0A423TX61_PENVA|nr:hypothetical protein C7M84_000194 [Penaeus vannamei]
MAEAPADPTLLLRPSGSFALVAGAPKGSFAWTVEPTDAGVGFSFVTGGARNFRSLGSRARPPGRRRRRGRGAKMATAACEGPAPPLSPFSAAPATRAAGRVPGEGAEQTKHSDSRAQRCDLHASHNNVKTRMICAPKYSTVNTAYDDQPIESAGTTPRTRSAYERGSDARHEGDRRCSQRSQVSRLRGGQHHASNTSELDPGIEDTARVAGVADWARSLQDACRGKGRAARKRCMQGGRCEWPAVRRSNLKSQSASTTLIMPQITLAHFLLLASPSFPLFLTLYCLIFLSLLPSPPHSLLSLHRLRYLYPRPTDLSPLLQSESSAQLPFSSLLFSSLLSFLSFLSLPPPLSPSLLLSPYSPSLSHPPLSSHGPQRNPGSSEASSRISEGGAVLLRALSTWATGGRP